MAEKAIGFVAILVIAVMTLPLWGTGLATFLDSDRTILSSSASPDGARIAQVERLTVGGVPNIVVMVRGPVETQLVSRELRGRVALWGDGRQGHMGVRYGDPHILTGCAPLDPQFSAVPVGRLSRHDGENVRSSLWATGW